MAGKAHGGAGGPAPRPGPSQRQLRVGEEIRHILAEILSRQDLRDPGLVDAAITVSEVRVSPDLRNATVFVWPLGGANLEAVLAGLGRAASFLSARVVKIMRLRSAPRLSFVADASFEEAGRIERLLRRPEVARDLVQADLSDRSDDDPLDRDR